MKKLLALTALFLSFSAYADTPTHHSYFNNNSVQLELNTTNIDLDDTPFKDIDWDFTFSLKTHLTNNLYSSVNVVKYDKDKFGYGATLGIQDPYWDLIPYSEVGYEHSYTDVKTISGKQLSYDTGVKLDTFYGIIPYVEADDYLDADRWYIKTGLRCNIGQHFYMIADYSFPSKTESNSLGVGAGFQF